MVYFVVICYYKIFLHVKLKTKIYIIEMKLKLHKCYLSIVFSRLFNELIIFNYHIHRALLFHPFIGNTATIIIRVSYTRHSMI